MMILVKFIPKSKKTPKELLTNEYYQIIESVNDKIEYQATKFHKSNKDIELIKEDFLTKNKNHFNKVKKINNLYNLQPKRAKCKL